MVEMYFIFLTSKKNGGYLADNTVLSSNADDFSTRITTEININTGTVALFSQNRANAILTELGSLVKKHKPNATFSGEIQKKMVSPEDVQTIMNKGYTFTCEAPED